RQAISRPPSKPVHPRGRRSRRPCEYMGAGTPCKHPGWDGKGAFTPAAVAVRAMLRAMGFLRGVTRLVPSAARLRVPLRGYVLALLALVASLLTVLLYWRSAEQREMKAVQAEFTAETDAIAELLRQRL